MDPMRIMQADMPQIRSTVRRVRHVLREEHDRLETDMAARMADPAARIALHVLRNMRILAGGLDGLLSDVAHKAFPEEGDRVAVRAEAPGGSAFRPRPTTTLLSLVAERLGIDGNATRLIATQRALGALAGDGGQRPLAAEEAARHYSLLTENAVEPTICLPVFATLLLLMNEPSGLLPQSAMAKRAADLSRALKDDILSCSTRGDRRQIASLLEKYAAHV